MKKQCLPVVLMALALIVTGLTWWLFNPFATSVWRIKLTMPVVGPVLVNVYPLLQLSTSLPELTGLSAISWRSRFGVITVANEPEGLVVGCKACNMIIPELDTHKVTLSNLTILLGRIDHRISGRIAVNNSFTILYNGTADMQGIKIFWSMPATSINKLVNVFKLNSPVLRSAKATGKLSVTGTLMLPAWEWSVKPELQSFSVSGLGTERLRTSAIKYHCPTLTSQTLPLPFTWIDPNSMGRWLPRAVIIAEDAHFREHPGYDIYAIRTILSHPARSKQLGGSTLTQQLAKNLFTGGKRTWLRKLEELFYAVEMENTIGKQRIFAMYLNTVDWGPGICGAGQAAQIYFHRTPAQLTPVQAAWLASIIRNPHHAWVKQFTTKSPDLTRLKWVMRYMPKRVKFNPASLAFALQSPLKNVQIK